MHHGTQCDSNSRDLRDHDLRRRPPSSILLKSESLSVFRIPSGWIGSAPVSAEELLRSAANRGPTVRGLRRLDCRSSIRPRATPRDRGPENLRAKHPRIKRAYIPIPPRALGAPTTGPVAMAAKSRAPAARRVSA